MAARTILVETGLPTTADKVWEAMKHPASLLYVTRGLLGLPALAGRTDPIHAGEAGTGWVFAFNLIPVYRHTIEVLDVDERTRSIRTHEHGGILKRWDHTLHVEPTSETTSRYSDTVEIDAGVLTRIMCIVSIGIYHYRQRRWHRLVRKHLLPTGRTVSATRLPESSSPPRSRPPNLSGNDE